MNELDEKFKLMKDSLKKLLQKHEHICVTCDVWSSRGQSYLGVTVHFITENFQRESYVLAFKRLYYRQTYIELAQELDNIFNDYEIKMEQITNIVTDGGSAFCKMFKKFGSTVDIVVETTSDNEDEEDAMATNPNSEDIVQQFMQNDDGELFQSEILQLDSQQASEANIYFGDDILTDEPQFKLPPQRRCFSHLLNLTSHDFEKNLPLNAERAFIASYNKLHALWHTSNRSSYAKSVCSEILGCLLSIPCETRWNSKFDSMKQVYEIMRRESNFERNPINAFIRKLKCELQSAGHLQLFDTSDFCVITKYVKVMEPIANALDTLQGEYNCSQGLILPVLLSMKHRVSSLDENSNIGADFKRTILKVIISMTRASSLK